MWVPADIAETSVERHEQTVGTCRSLQDFGIVLALESFGASRVDVMTVVPQKLGLRLREVLVELYSHWDETAGYSSRASSAPYAAAARMRLHRQRRILGDDLFLGHPVRERIQMTLTMIRMPRTTA